MKKSIIAMALLGTISASAMANQGSGRINFTGEIIAAPCSITAETMDQTVSLGQISNVALTQGGSSPVHNFNITLSECNFTTEEYDRTAQITFNGNTVGQATAEADEVLADYLAMTGFNDSEAANFYNVAIEIRQAGTNALVDLSGATPVDVTDLQNGNNDLPFSANVRGASTATAEQIPLGNFSALANFAISYN
jgi:type 1 fimbria pilin